MIDFIIYIIKQIKKLLCGVEIDETHKRHHTTYDKDGHKLSSDDSFDEIKIISKSDNKNKTLK